MTTIGMIAEVFDGPHATPKKTESGPYFLSISSLDGGRFDLSKSAHLNEEQFITWTRRVTPQEGDVLFSYETRLGEAAMMPGGIRACLGRRMGLLRPNRDLVIPEYLLYAYLSKSFQKEIQKRKIHGATVERIALKELPSFPVRIPSMDEQKTAVELLGSLDDKIELNRQMNKTLEEMAQAIFKSWFVDFEPVKAKAEAKANGLSKEAIERAAMAAIAGKPVSALDQLPTETLQSLAHKASLFPDSFESSELGEIPSGWTVGSIGEETDTVGGATPSTKHNEYWENGDIHWVTPKDFSHLQDKILISSSRKITEAGLVKISSGLLPENTVLMSSRAPVGYLAISKIETAINQGFIAMKCTKRLTPEYVLQWANYRMSDIKQAASGSTFAEISKKTFRPFSITVPSTEVLKLYSIIVSPFYDKITENVRESVNLAELRDTLLPKLLSGELPIKAKTRDLAESAIF